MNKIRNNLYVGNAKDATNATYLKKEKITAILNVAYEVNDPIYSITDIRTHKVGLADSSDNSKPVRQLAIDTLKSLLQAKEKVLVHCGAGQSRAVFVTCFALADLENKDPHDIFEEVRNERPFAMKGGLWLDFGYKPIGYAEEDN